MNPLGLLDLRNLYKYRVPKSEPEIRTDAIFF